VFYKLSKQVINTEKKHTWSFVIQRLRLVFVLLCFIFLSTNTFAQVPSNKIKKQKEIPRFPPQYNATLVAQKKDSLNKAKLPAKKTVTQKSTGGNSLPTKKGIDSSYRVISSTVDADGNKVEVIEKRVNGYVIKQTIRSSGQKLNKLINPDTINKDSTKIVIDKTKYKLLVYYKGKYLTSYRCVFGIQPVGQKMFEGDKKTPEGDFFISEMRPHSEWTYFFGINYPTEESRRIFEQNLKAGKIPPGKAIGGSVGIHGVFAGGDGVITDKHNWTDGCIALNTKDISELNRIIKVGTPILIKK
jgi:lipoprotein-anchoring transpeptidase ErfK/SrfK